MKIIVAALVLCALSSQVQAGCTCQCVNGQMQPLCSSALDIAPPCIGICGPVAPSIAPINPPTIPPLGHHIVPPSTNLRPVRKLPLATSLSLKRELKVHADFCSCSAGPAQGFEFNAHCF